MLNDKPNESSRDDGYYEQEASASVPYRIVLETSLVDVDSSKGLLGLTLRLEGDPRSQTNLNPTHVLTPELTHRLHLQLSEVCHLCRS